MSLFHTLKTKVQNANRREVRLHKMVVKLMSGQARNTITHFAIELIDTTGVLIYEYWLLMKGMVENYCPRGEIQPWPTIHRGPYE